MASLRTFCQGVAWGITTVTSTAYTAASTAYNVLQTIVDLTLRGVKRRFEYAALAAQSIDRRNIRGNYTEAPHAIEERSDHPDGSVKRRRLVDDDYDHAIRARLSPAAARRSSRSPTHKGASRPRKSKLVLTKAKRLESEQSRLQIEQMLEHAREHERAARLTAHVALQAKDYEVKVPGASQYSSKYDLVSKPHPYQPTKEAEAQHHTIKPRQYQQAGRHTRRPASPELQKPQGPRNHLHPQVPRRRLDAAEAAVHRKLGADRVATHKNTEDKAAREHRGKKVVAASNAYETAERESLMRKNAACNAHLDALKAKDYEVKVPGTSQYISKYDLVSKPHPHQLKAKVAENLQRETAERFAELQARKKEQEEAGKTAELLHQEQVIQQEEARKNAERRAELQVRKEEQEEARKTAELVHQEQVIQQEEARNATEKQAREAAEVQRREQDAKRQAEKEAEARISADRTSESQQEGEGEEDPEKGGLGKDGHGHYVSAADVRRAARGNRRQQRSKLWSPKDQKMMEERESFTRSNTEINKLPISDWDQYLTPDHNKRPPKEVRFLISPNSGLEAVNHKIFDKSEPSTRLDSPEQPWPRRERFCPRVFDDFLRNDGKHPVSIAPREPYGLGSQAGWLHNFGPAPVDVIDTSIDMTEDSPVRAVTATPVSTEASAEVDEALVRAEAPLATEAPPATEAPLSTEASAEVHESPVRAEAPLATEAPPATDASAEVQEPVDVEMTDVSPLRMESTTTTTSATNGGTINASSVDASTNGVPLPTSGQRSGFTEPGQGRNTVTPRKLIGYASTDGGDIFSNLAFSTLSLGHVHSVRKTRDEVARLTAKKKAEDEAKEKAEAEAKAKAEADAKAKAEAEEQAKIKAAEEARVAKEKAEAEAKEEEERKKGGRRMPREKFVQPLSSAWENQLRMMMSKPRATEVLTTPAGATLRVHDFASVLIEQKFLNDEIINAYLEQTVDEANKAAGSQKFVCQNSFFYDNLAKDPSKVSRWMKRKKAGGEKMLDLEATFIPVNKDLHWTLIVVSPRAKTIEYLDSLSGPPDIFVANIRKWLKMELGNKYIAEEWTVPNTASARQRNGYDCGVFLVTNAKCISMGLDPTCYDGTDMAMQRRRIAAEIINKGSIANE